MFFYTPLETLRCNIQDHRPDLYRHLAPMRVWEGMCWLAQQVDYPPPLQTDPPWPYCEKIWQHMVKTGRDKPC